MITDIVAHLTAEFADNWTACPFKHENQPPVDMDEHDAWVGFSVRLNDQKARSHGSPKRVQQMMRVYLQIFTRKGEYTGPALDLAQEFIEIFRFYRHHETDFSIEGEEPSSPQVFNDDEDEWYQVNISIPMKATFWV